MNALPLYCPSCQNKLKVKSLICENCDTLVQGLYSLPVLASLNINEQLFILDFVRSSGSLKEMAKHLNLSYPTVRNLLDEIIEKINILGSETSTENKEEKK
jgi:hypothetical protein